ncbi:hypothetical protein Pla175_09430 [Pirellulimonas nuda]|uniref:Bacterial type II and III secretion system protein n=1 Tax=Pirellulimonas nuda TaxID=2528009 RepID=A0A518D7W6_9BACT|nr:DUF6263 family protein [Pirellulimonas nuda]QDU87578.1 hypothetical protein Pla175_09430 [Pirellulimonas nuda]
MLRLIACCGSLLISAGAAFGDAPTRWKFAEGESLRMRMRQEMTTQVNTGDDPPVATEMTQETVVRFDVTEVNNDGSAQATQTIERVVVDAGSAAIKNTHYDSDSDEPADGLGAMTAPLFGVLVGAPITMTIGPTGEVSDVTLDSKLAETLKNNPLAKTSGTVFSEEGIKRIVQQCVTQLPAGALEVGQTSTDQVEVESPVGVLRLSTTYTYAGQRTEAGRTVRVFETRTEQAIVDGGEPAAVKAEIVDQDGVGELVFDAEAGRPVSSSKQSSFTMKLSDGVDGGARETRTKLKVSSAWSVIEPDEAE